MKQKESFLQIEGNKWLERNLSGLTETKLPDQDALLLEYLDLRSRVQEKADTWRILEIGCGNGQRLSWIKREFGNECYGIDPSSEAIKIAKNNGVEASVGTADSLPFEDSFFDLVIFGFCLYLCDREDLFKIAAEANRVLKQQSWIMILDFHAEAATKNPYVHRDGLYSYKMAYESLFTWHPSFICTTKRILDYHNFPFKHTDDPAAMTAISVIRKNG